MLSSSKRCQTVATVLGAVLTLGSVNQARAEQFTFFDFTYEATTKNTHDAHYDVRSPAYPLPQPDNWKSPIDYTAGTVYIEQDVLTKPSMEDTQVDVCFLTGGYGCLNTKHYFTTGRFTTVKPVKSFWNFGNINWTKKIPLVQLIVKDKNNANGGRPVSNFMPTKMRIALTVVSPGGTYTPPPGFSAAPASDAGVPSDAATGDAEPAAAPDAEITSPAGSGGAGGTSGGPVASGGSSGSSPGGASGGASGSGGSGGSGGTGSSTTGTGGSRPPNTTPNPPSLGNDTGDEPATAACTIVGRGAKTTGSTGLLALVAAGLILARRRHPARRR